MRVVEFTIPVAKENSVIVQEDMLPHFYNHLHRHNEAQITWVIKGEGTLIAADHMQPFRAGDIYILGANQPHIFRNDPVYFNKKNKKEVHSLTIFFNPDGFFKSILNLPETKAIRRFVSEMNFGLQLPKEQQTRVSKEMLRVKDTKQGFRLAAFINLLQDMASVKGWKKLAAVSVDNTFSDQEGLRMNDVYHFTMSHYSDNITLKQVADVAFLTPQAFCRYFKKHTRKTYIAFLSEIRVSEACKKIVAGDFESISSIAYDTGFNSAVSFNRVFKKITGQSPKQYLREYNQKTD